VTGTLINRNRKLKLLLTPMLTGFDEFKTCVVCTWISVCRLKCLYGGIPWKVTRNVIAIAALSTVIKLLDVLG